MDRREIGRMELIFTHIYRENAWGNSESRSGPGSTRARAADFTDDLIDLLKRVDTRVLLDAACGDFHWTRPVADAVDHYIGLDVVPELIDHHLQENAAPGRTFMCGDLTVDVLPKADVILCRDCLVHLSFDDARSALRNFQRSGSRFLLTTTFIARGPNEDIDTGWWRPLDMEAWPFSWPAPLALVDERCTHTGGIYRNKRLGLWALSDISACCDQPSAIGDRLSARTSKTD